MVKSSGTGGRTRMSIYCTLWELQFPRDGDCADPENPAEWTTLWAQGVPGHIDDTGPIWDWLPPPVPDKNEYMLRAVVIVDNETDKGTERNGQEYVDTLLVLS